VNLGPFDGDTPISAGKISIRISAHNHQIRLNDPLEALRDQDEEMLALATACDTQYNDRT
jgi:hypothetical protein